MRGSLFASLLQFRRFQTELEDEVGGDAKVVSVQLNLVPVPILKVYFPFKALNDLYMPMPNLTKVISDVL